MYRSGASFRVRSTIGAPGGSSADAVSDSAATARTSSHRGRRTAFGQRPVLPHSASFPPSSGCPPAAASCCLACSCAVPHAGECNYDNLGESGLRTVTARASVCSYPAMRCNSTPSIITWQSQDS